MIIWRLIGGILEWIGKRFERSDILFLGYYLSGTGITRSLPVYTHQIVVNEFNIGYQLPDTYIPHVFFGSILYNTIGKAWVKRENDIIYVKDKYLFYPLCDNSDTHFDDCTCIHKEYSHLHKAVYLDYNLVQKLYKTPLKNLKVRIPFYEDSEISISIECISISILDSFWVNKGKPFNVYCEIPVNKI